MTSLAQRLLAEVTAPETRSLVTTYFARDTVFIGDLFDTLPDNPPDRITATDLFAVTMLGMDFPPRAVRALLEDRDGHINRLLTALPTDRPLWDNDVDLRPAYDLWDLLRSGGDYSGLGPTTVSKILARKRPHLIPILDTVIREALHFTGDAWAELRTALADEELRGRLEDLRPGHVHVSTLRILDAALWMRHSHSRAARLARNNISRNPS